MPTMIYYQFNLHQNIVENKPVLTNIIEKETGMSMPIPIVEDKVTSMKWHDQTFGDMMVFFSQSKALLEAFKDGIKVGKKIDTLL